MATYGLVIYNKAGQTQIDDKYFAWTIQASGSIYAGSTVVNPSPSNGNQITKRITFAGSDDTIFAMYCPSGVGGILKTSYSGGVWTVDFVIARDINEASVVSDNGAKWFAINRPLARPADEGYGLELYDTSGRIAYSSLWRMKSPVNTTPGNSSKKYAFIGGRLTYTYVVETEEMTVGEYQIDRYTYVEGSVCNNGTITTSEVLYKFSSESRTYGVPGSTTDVSGIDLPRLAIDVTELV